MNGTLFFVLGGCLAGLAVITSFVGIKSPRFPPSNGVMWGTILLFAALVIATTTFAVRHSADEQEARAAETREAEAAAAAGGKEAAAPQGAGKEGAEGASKKSGAAAQGPGGTLQLEADPSKLAFDTKQLASKPGKVTIDLTNPAPLEHDVAIEQNGTVIAVSKRVAEGKTSVSANLKPGTYTFLCTVPGHAAAGMEGTLTVK